jgi:invasion protein IalB
MMHFRRTAAALAMGAWISLSVSAHADDAKRLGTFGSWEAYAYSDAAGKLCYAAARAAKTNGGEARRAGVALAVTHRAKSPNEISLVAPFGLKKNADIEIQVGGKKHSFFGKGDAAWAKDAASDKAIVAQLLKAKEVVVRASPAKGSAITDTVMLDGFGAALAAIDKACGVKR